MRLRISNKRGIVGADLNICISMCLKGPNPTASLFTTFLTEIEFIQNLTYLDPEQLIYVLIHKYFKFIKNLNNLNNLNKMKSALYFSLSMSNFFILIIAN